MAPWWVTLAGVATTGVLAWAAQAWAKRGRSPEGLAALNGAAMNMLTHVDGRVQRLERIDGWRESVKIIDNDHIDLLESWIWRGADPPPPPRPTYPSRPE